MPKKLRNSSASGNSKKFENTGSKNCLELPKADPDLLKVIAKDTTQFGEVDGVKKHIRFYGDTAVVFLDWDDPREIKFEDATRTVSISLYTEIECSVGKYTEFDYGEKNYRKTHRIKLGAPTRELYINDQWYHCEFGGSDAFTINLGVKKVRVILKGAPPDIEIGTIKRTDLVLGRVNLIVNPTNSVFPIFLDAKPQMFNIEGEPVTLQFIDCFKRVVLNGKPLDFEFNGLAKPIKFNGKEYFIRFTKIPEPFKAGRVKVVCMKGEELQDKILEKSPAARNETFELFLPHEDEDGDEQVKLFDVDLLPEVSVAALGEKSDEDAGKNQLDDTVTSPFDDLNLNDA